MAKCSVESCANEAVARGWCPKHWWRWRQHGSPDYPTIYDLSTEQRFWKYVDRSGDCWLWTGARRGDGYGGFRSDGKQIGAHRFSYELHHGPITDGLVVMHSCDRPLCVNPDHLSLGTQADNSADASRKGRRSPGSKNHNAKLTEDQVLEMRERYTRGGVSHKDLARDYDVSTALVSFILTRKAWKHI